MNYFRLTDKLAVFSQRNPDNSKGDCPPKKNHQQRNMKPSQIPLNIKRRIKCHLPFEGIIRSSPYSSRFQDKG